MARHKKGTRINGWITLNKPVGVTSTQAVGIIRRALNAQKVGHGGTLDPLASGILPIALGEATKTVNHIQDACKTYHFTVTWGEQRSTDDAEGEIIRKSDNRPSIEAIEKILPDFIGEIEQTPPQFSAIKIDGERAYDLARDGQQVVIKSRQVTIQALEILPDEGRSGPARLRSLNETQFRCKCGKGTYIRSLARDMGEKLGCYGYISALERSRVGAMRIENAISLDFFKEMIDNPDQCKDLERIVSPLQTVLDDIPALALKDSEAVRVQHGNPLSFLSKPDLNRLEQIGIDWKADKTHTIMALYEGKALAIMEVYGAAIKPLKVFNL